MRFTIGFIALVLGVAFFPASCVDAAPSALPVTLDVSAGNPFGNVSSDLYKPLVSIGNTATKGQFPWLTALWIYSNGVPSAFCGGVLVAPNAVLTAAHCLWGRSDANILATRVLVGAYKSDPNNCDGCEERKITSYYLNDYIESDTEFNNDIALLFLNQPSTKSPARLTARFPAKGELGRVAGWGYTAQSSSVSPLPIYTDMEVLGTDGCSAYSFYVPETSICTGSYGQYPNGMTSTTCSGDSGGPMVIKGTNDLVGLVSYAISNENDDDQCGTWARIAYMSVAYYLPWLQSKGLNVAVVPAPPPPLPAQPSPVVPNPSPVVPTSPAPSVPSPTPSVPSPTPIVSPPPSNICPLTVKGTYRIQSVKCKGRYLAFTSPCSRTVVNLRTTLQARGRLTYWKLNATVGKFSRVQADRICTKRVLASATKPTLGSGTITWQYKLVRPSTSACNTFNMVGKSSIGAGKYLSVKSDCSGFEWRTSGASRNAKFKLSKVPLPSPTPVAQPQCPSMTGTYRFASTYCTGRYISFATNCNDTLVRLRTASQAFSPRTHWKINAEPDTLTNIRATRTCDKTILASNATPSLGSGTITWQYKITPYIYACDHVALQAKSGQGKGLFLGVKSDCSGFYYRAEQSSPYAEWRMMKV